MQKTLSAPIKITNEMQEQHHVFQVSNIGEQGVHPIKISNRVGSKSEIYDDEDQDVSNIQVGLQAADSSEPSNEEDEEVEDYTTEQIENEVDEEDETQMKMQHVS
jgi:hypothetical protein